MTRWCFGIEVITRRAEIKQIIHIYQSPRLQVMLFITIAWNLHNVWPLYDSLQIFCLILWSPSVKIFYYNTTFIDAVKIYGNTYIVDLDALKHINVLTIIFQIRTNFVQLYTTRLFHHELDLRTVTGTVWWTFANRSDIVWNT